MKRIFAVMMALMMILSTTSQAYVVTIYGQNCTYTMTSPANREITVNDTSGNVRWWKVEDTSNNIIGVINGTFVTPDKDVTVTPMTEGNQIIIQQTANGTIKYNGNAVNTVETTQGSNYTLTITPIEGGEINSVTVDGTELAESEITKSGMSYTFSNVNENHIITATYTLIGDVNEDGYVNQGDRIMLIRYLAGTWGITLTEQQKINADVNMDGNTDIYDKRILMCYCADWSKVQTLPYTEKMVVFVSGSPNDSFYTEEVQLFENGETKALSPSGSITKEGYALIGWTTTAGGTTVEYEEGANFTANENTTLYAVWKLYGDVNDDGTVTQADYDMIVEAYSRDIFEFPVPEKVADVDLSGTINMRDILLIHKYLSGDVPSLPRRSYTITQTAGENGEITQSGAAYEGMNVTITITPDAGYKIGTVTIDGVDLLEEEITATGMSYEFTNLAADHTVSATFVAK